MGKERLEKKKEKKKEANPKSSERFLLCAIASPPLNNDGCPGNIYKVINSFEDGLWTIMRQAGRISNKSEAVQHSLERFLCMKVSTDMKRTTCFQKACIPSTHTYCPLIVLLN